MAIALPRPDRDRGAWLGPTPVLPDVLRRQQLNGYPSIGTDWVTTFLTVTVTPGQEDPSTETQISKVTTTQTLQPGQTGTVTQTVYVTQTQTETQVVYPVYTTNTQTATVYPTYSWLTQTTTTTPKPSKTYSPAPAKVKRPCLDGDQYEKVHYGPLRPTHTQATTLIILFIMMFVLLFAWNFIVLRSLLYPIKLLATAIHEFGHVFGVILNGQRIVQFQLDPNEGGITSVEGGRYAIAAVPFGFLFSIIIGGVFVFCGFNTLASKVASFFIGMMLLVLLWMAAGFISKLSVAGALGLMIGFWFIDHASVLRFFVLFVGLASLFYVIWDTMDDLVFRKANPSCVQLFAVTFPIIPPHVWAIIWLGISILVLILFILLALLVWRQTGHGMYCQSQTFLPT